MFGYIDESNADSFTVEGTNEYDTIKNMQNQSARVEMNCLFVVLSTDAVEEPFEK